MTRFAAVIRDCTILLNTMHKVSGIQVSDAAVQWTIWLSRGLLEVQ
jgi:hypothetical protein